MERRFTVIPQDTFDNLQLDVGVLLKTFNPSSPSAPSDADIITATTGGISAHATPTYVDMGEDVDNCPNNTKELKEIQGWDCGISTTALAASAEIIKLSLGAADATTTATYSLTTDTAIVTGKKYYTRSGTSPNYTYTQVTNPSAQSLSSYYELTSSTSTILPRATLSQSDFEDAIWWVGDRADGGLAAIKIMNVLSSGGFSLQTTKKGKGQFTLELTGHFSLNDLDTVPMEFYVIN